MEDFTAALESKILLKELLKNDDWERLFRAGLRSKDEKLLAYLGTKEILADMIEALVNEEERTLQEASEVLGVLLTNLDPVNDALVADHLGALFSYLGRKLMNPRRMYFFLRLSSFLFQNRTQETLAFAISNEGFTQKLVNNLASPHIMQLILLILNLERQMKAEDHPNCDWSTKTNLIGSIVNALSQDPTNNIDAVFKFLQEICNHNDVCSDFVKSTILANDGALTSCLVSLVKTKHLAQDAIRLLDEHILKIVMANQGDQTFFEAATKQLLTQRCTFEEMLKSESLMNVLSGVKFIHALVKHKAFFLLGDGLETCVNLIFRFPWSNILHNGVVVVISYVFLEEQDQFITSLLDAGLLRKIVEGLASATPHGYKPHLRQIAAAMQMTQSTAALERFATDPLWEKYWFIMEVRKNTSLTFVEAEREVVAKLAEALDELDGKSPAAAPTPVEGGAPAGAVDVKEPETPVVGEETQTDKVETQVVATESVASTPSDEKPTEEVAKVETPTETTPVTPEAADVHVDEKPKDEVVATTPVESDVKVDEKPVEEPAKVETPAPAAVDEKPVESSNSDVKVDEKSESSNDSTPAVAVVPDADVKPQETTSSDASAAPGEADKSGDASSTADRKSVV